MFKFVTRNPNHHALMVTWPLGSDQVIRFRKGIYETADEALAKHLRSLASVMEIRATATEAQDAPSPKGEAPRSAWDLVRAAEKAGIVTKHKGWFMYGETTLGKSQGDVTKAMEDNPEIAKAIAEALQD